MQVHGVQAHPGGIQDVREERTGLGVLRRDHQRTHKPIQRHRREWHPRKRRFKGRSHLPVHRSAVHQRLRFNPGRQGSRRGRGRSSHGCPRAHLPARAQASDPVGSDDSWRRRVVAQTDYPGRVTRAQEGASRRQARVRQHRGWRGGQVQERAVPPSSSRPRTCRSSPTFPCPPTPLAWSSARA